MPTITTLDGVRVTLTNARELVLKHEPKARLESYSGHDGKRYHLVRTLRGRLHIGEGNTKARAWKDAAEAIAARPGGGA